MTALADNPEDRYPSAAAFAARVTALLTAAQDASRLKTFLDELFEVEREREADEERAMFAAADRMAEVASPLAEVPESVRGGAAATPSGVSLVEGALAREISGTPQSTRSVASQRRLRGWLAGVGVAALLAAAIFGARSRPRLARSAGQPGRAGAGGRRPCDRR